MLLTEVKDILGWRFRYFNGSWAFPSNEVVFPFSNCPCSAIWRSCLINYARTWSNAWWAPELSTEIFTSVGAFAYSSKWSMLGCLWLQLDIIFPNFLQFTLTPRVGIEILKTYFWCRTVNRHLGCQPSVNSFIFTKRMTPEGELRQSACTT